MKVRQSESLCITFSPRREREIACPSSRMKRLTQEAISKGGQAHQLVEHALLLPLTRPILLIFPNLSRKNFPAHRDCTPIQSGNSSRYTPGRSWANALWGSTGMVVSSCGLTRSKLERTQDIPARRKSFMSSTTLYLL